MLGNLSSAKAVQAEKSQIMNRTVARLKKKNFVFFLSLLARGQSYKQMKPKCQKHPVGATN